MSKPVQAGSLSKGIGFVDMSQTFNENESKQIIGLFFDCLVSQGFKPEETMLSFDSDGTITFHTWSVKGEKVKEKLQFSNIPFFKALCAEATNRGFGVVIDSKQYRSEKTAKGKLTRVENPIGLEQIYDGIDIIGREEIDIPGANKGSALKKHLEKKGKVIKHVVGFDDDSTNMGGRNIINAQAKEQGYYEEGYNVIALCGISDKPSSKMLLPVMKFWSQGDHSIGEDKEQYKTPFGICPESLLLFAIDQGVEIPANLINKAKADSKERLEDILAESLNIKGQRRVAKDRKHVVLCLIEGRGDKITKEQLSKEGVNTVDELRSKILLEERVDDIEGLREKAIRLGFIKSTVKSKEMASSASSKAPAPKQTAVAKPAPIVNKWIVEEGDEATKPGFEAAIKNAGSTVTSDMLSKISFIKAPEDKILAFQKFVQAVQELSSAAQKPQSTPVKKGLFQRVFGRKQKDYSLSEGAKIPMQDATFFENFLVLINTLKVLETQDEKGTFVSAAPEVSIAVSILMNSVDFSQKQKKVLTDFVNVVNAQTIEEAKSSAIKTDYLGKLKELLESSANGGPVNGNIYNGETKVDRYSSKLVPKGVEATEVVYEFSEVGVLVIVPGATNQKPIFYREGEQGLRDLVAKVRNDIEAEKARKVLQEGVGSSLMRMMEDEESVMEEVSTAARKPQHAALRKEKVTITNGRPEIVDVFSGNEVYSSVKSLGEDGQVQVGKEAFQSEMAANRATKPSAPAQAQAPVKPPLPPLTFYEAALNLKEVFKNAVGKVEGVTTQGKNLDQVFSIEKNNIKHHYAIRIYEEQQECDVLRSIAGKGWEPINSKEIEIITKETEFLEAALASKKDSGVSISTSSSELSLSSEGDQYLEIGEDIPASQKLKNALNKVADLSPESVIRNGGQYEYKNDQGSFFYEFNERDGLEKYQYLTKGAENGPNTAIMDEFSIKKQAEIFEGMAKNLSAEIEAQLKSERENSNSSKLRKKLEEAAKNPESGVTKINESSYQFDNYKYGFSNKGEVSTEKFLVRFGYASIETGSLPELKNSDVKNHLEFFETKLKKLQEKQAPSKSPSVLQRGGATNVVGADHSNTL